MEPIEAAIEESIAGYAQSNPGSRRAFARAQASMPGGNTRSALYWHPFPLYLERSWDAYVRDVDGHDYLDVLGEYTAGLYGHRDPFLCEAVREVLDRGFSNAAPGEADTDLADLICARFPAVERVRFCNSGTEATLYALALARRHTGRERFIAFSGAYHGGVFIFADGGSPMNAPFDWTVCRYNDASGTSEAIRAIGKDLAAIIIEPMMSNGGCLPAEPDFLRMLRRECTAADALLIFDEIVTSRMGPGGCQGLTGVHPDLTTFGKYLGGGFGFGAFGGRADILDLMNPMRADALPHAGTFNNNAFSMTVGARALEGLFTAERAQRLYDDGERLRTRLNEVAASHGRVAQFTGCGSAMNIHFVRGAIRCPEDLASEPRGLFRLLHLDLLAAGIYAPPRGQINLSLPMGEAEFDRIVAAIDGWLGMRRGLIERSLAA